MSPESRKEEEIKDVAATGSEGGDARVKITINFKLLTYVLASLLVVVVSSVAVTLYLFRETPLSGGIKAALPIPNPDTIADEKHSSEAAFLHLAPQSLQLNGFLIEITDQQGAPKILACDFTLVFKPDYEAPIIADERLIRKLFYQELLKKKPAELTGKVNINILKNDLKLKLHDFFDNKDVVDAVLITNFLII